MKKLLLSLVAFISFASLGFAVLVVESSLVDFSFIDDFNPTMLGDILKFVGGAQTGNLNFSVDRLDVL
jgi:hypothetical protein